MSWCYYQAQRWLEYCVRRASLIAHISGIENLSFRFSGDTIPAGKLVIAGNNATLLIHEASMADDQLDLATSKMHSTFGQAVDVGRR